MVAIPIASAATVAFWRFDTAIRAAGLLCALALPWLLLLSGLWSRLQLGLQGFTGRRPLTLAALSGAAYGLAWSLVGDGLALAHRIDGQALGFDQQGWASWLDGRLTATAILAACGAAGAAIGYTLIAKSPRRWALWAAGAVILLGLAYCVSAPVLANNAPLPPGPLKAQIQAMLGKAGAGPVPIVLRRDSGPCVGGNNLGVFPTTQVVIDDGYLAYPADQGVEVAAHEVGHYVRHDPELGVMVGMLWIGAMFAAMSWGGRRLVAALGGRFGIADLGEPASLPLILFCAVAVYAAGLPAFNAIQRGIEHRADQFAMTMTGYGQAGAIGMARDAKCGRLDPNPSWLRTVLFENHPSIAQRISFMNRYDAAQLKAK